MHKFCLTYAYFVLIDSLYARTASPALKAKNSALKPLFMRFCTAAERLTLLFSFLIAALAADCAFSISAPSEADFSSRAVSFFCSAGDIFARTALGRGLFNFILFY